ncbi:MAG: HAMP domain-containing sensor histidine kinase [Eubacteriales bacterium]|nr:HAMP domain-containing sensor histidine kinase [Eubacteriales bacterium]
MFRNRELRPFAISFACVAIVTVILGFAIGPAAGVLSVVSSAAFGTVFFVFTRMRYRRIAHMAEQIDRVLHNADVLYIGEEEEGELSILQSEITKMTLRIREQNEALKREKEHLSDSLADIAHQLRTPLTSANLILSLLENSPDEAERKALLRETAELFVQMEWLLNSLLKLSRLDAGIVTLQMEQVDGNRLIGRAARPLLISMELHNIALRIRIPEGMQIPGDPSWLAEAIQNILKNSVQSIGDNGWIEITGEDTPLFGQILIHDSGPGFEKEDLPHLFERFYRGKKEGATGYGIGLALCKGIITRHGGTITAKNHPQCGAVFCIRFPK